MSKGQVLTLSDGVMPTDDVCILIMELSVADWVDAVPRILRYMPDFHRLSHDLKLTVQTILVILPSHTFTPVLS